MKLLIVFLVLLPLSLAATLEGNIYDLDLQPVSNVIVQINTTPRQQVITKEGMFSFEVPAGSYTLKAMQQNHGENRGEADENITISQTGTYRFDMILLPLVEEEILSEDIELPFTDENGSGNGPSLYWALLLLGFAAFFAYKPKEAVKEDNDPAMKELLEAINKHEGRIEQRELRKALPWSEAKVSLLITQLEAEGKVEKIRKGRANILVLKNR